LISPAPNHAAQRIEFTPQPIAFTVTATPQSPDASTLPNSGTPAGLTGFSPDNVFRNNRYGTDRFLAPALSSSSPSAPFSLRVKIAID